MENATIAAVAFDSMVISDKQFYAILEHLQLKLYTNCFLQNGFDIDKSNRIECND